MTEREGEYENASKRWTPGPNFDSTPIIPLNPPHPPFKAFSVVSGSFFCLSLMSEELLLKWALCQPGGTIESQSSPPILPLMLLLCRFR